MKLCVVFQLKQLGNKVFEENNLYSNWVFCRGYFNLSPFIVKIRKFFINVEFTGRYIDLNIHSESLSVHTPVLIDG